MQGIEATLAFDLRATWQARALVEAKGQLGAVVLSVLAHNYDGAMPTLLRVAFPDFISITAPFYCSAAKVAKSGRVVADVVTKNGNVVKDSLVFESEEKLRDEFRRLADRLKLSDADRVEMFDAVKRWVVADRRLDPEMDPLDPEAKRLVH